MGYHRADGRVGTRNFWLVLTLFSGSTDQLVLLREAFQRVLGYQTPNAYLQQLRELQIQYRAGSYFETPPSAPTPTPRPLFANIDGIKFLPDPLEETDLAVGAGPVLDVLAKYCAHPNVGGITVLCNEKADGLSTAYSVETLRQRINQYDIRFDKPLLSIDRQTYATEQDWLSAATSYTFRAMEVLNQQHRRATSVANLVIGSQNRAGNSIIDNPIVRYCLNSMASVGATVLVANAEPKPIENQPSLHSLTQLQLSPAQGINQITLPGDELEVATTLTTAGCTVQLAPPDLDFLLENAMKPALAITPTCRKAAYLSNNMATSAPAGHEGFNLTKLGQSFLNDLLKLASSAS